MAEVKAHRPGRFCWTELGTLDAVSAKRFYVELFGWAAVDLPIGPDAVYSMLQKDGKDVAALYQLGKAQLTLGVPAHWLSYVAVANVDEAAKRAQELGATLRSEPFDVMQAGRMAVFLDPTGAALALWQAGKHIGSALVIEPGAPCWRELWTTDTDAAGTFYAALFDWQREAPGPTGSSHTLFRSSDVRVGGMTPLASESSRRPPHWVTFFAVESCDDTAIAAKQMGGHVVVPPAEIPSVGRFAVLSDREGATFGVIQLY